MVLTDTGERREGLPVVARHPSSEPYETELTRGFSGRLLRLYRMAQRYAHPGRPPRPAYLVLSDTRGGFPRHGFHLDGRAMSDAAYVDLHRRSALTNRFGAVNQIYPHELVHLIVEDLAGPIPRGRDNQTHAVAVRTDRVTAFSEGFAEHAQVMAVEAAGVSPDTSRLPHDAAIRAAAHEQLDAYRAAVEARWSMAPKARMTFAVWFSANEQVLRYHAVRENLFAREPAIPPRVRSDNYRAYLLENTLPGVVDAAAKSAARLLATEGVVSALFYRLATSDALQRAFREEAFYGEFGVTRAEVDPGDNVYLKLFTAIREGGYDTTSVLDAYTRLFPEDAAGVGAIVRDSLLGQGLPRGRSIWLLSDQLSTGTSLFDQYRGLPRPHTFDLNAASATDLASVRGVTPDVASSILAGAPYESIGELWRVPAARPLVPEFMAREAAYREHIARLDAAEGPSVRKVLLPYIWRALLALLGSAVVSSGLYRLVRRARWYRVALNGSGIAVAGLLAGWTIDPGTGVLAFAAPIGFWGLPAAVIALWRTRSPRRAGLVLAAWSLASVVPALVVRPVG